jgi:hypothetical protein
MRTAYAMPLHLDREDHFLPFFTLPQLGTGALGIVLGLVIYFFTGRVIPELPRTWLTVFIIAGGLCWYRTVWQNATLAEYVGMLRYRLSRPGRAQYQPGTRRGALAGAQKHLVGIKQIVGPDERPVFVDTKGVPFMLIEVSCVPLQHWEEHDAIPFLSKLAGALNALGNDLKLVTNTEDGRIKAHVKREQERIDLRREQMALPVVQMRTSQLAHLRQRAHGSADRLTRLFLLVTGKNETVVRPRGDRIERLFAPFGARLVSRAAGEILLAQINGAPDWTVTQFFDGKQHFFGTATTELVVSGRGAHLRAITPQGVPVGLDDVVR